MSTSTVKKYWVHDPYVIFLFTDGNYQVQKDETIVLTGSFTKKEMKELDLGQTIAERLEEQLHPKPEFSVDPANYPLPEYEPEIPLRIKEGYYNIPEEVAKYAYPTNYDLPDFASAHGRQIARAYYRSIGNALEKIFKRDLFHVLGITNHPKAEKLYSMAWERGHSSGYYDVFSEAQELAELLTYP